MAVVILMAIGQTTQAPGCDDTKFCCCGKMTGKFCMKNAKSKAWLVGICETDDDAVYECETSYYPAKFLKICSEVKGCESLDPRRAGVDFCEV